VLKGRALLKLGKPGAGEARIRHTAVGLNFVDIYNRSGLYPLQLPSGLGGEGAGVVEEVGPGVTDLKPGDRVAYGAAPLGEQIGAAGKGALDIDAVAGDSLCDAGGGDVLGPEHLRPHLGRR